MTYTIKEASDITGIPATTLRYYDKEGILPFLERKESGHRMFSEQDLSMLRIIECLKCTGMSIKDIRQCGHKWVTPPWSSATTCFLSAARPLWHKSRSLKISLK